MLRRSEISAAAMAARSPAAPPPTMTMSCSMVSRRPPGCGPALFYPVAKASANHEQAVCALDRSALSSGRVVGMLSSWLLLLWLAATLVADQVLKHIVLTGDGAARVLEIGPAVRIRPIRTRGAAAGRLGVHPVLLSFTWVGCLLTVLLVAPRAGRFESQLAEAALGAAFGGAAGN